MIPTLISLGVFGVLYRDFATKKDDPIGKIMEKTGKLSEDARNAILSSPYGNYPAPQWGVDAHDLIFDAGLPEYPKYQGDPNLKDMNSVLNGAPEPNSKESKLIEKTNPRWMKVAGQYRRDDFFDKHRGRKLHASKYELNDYMPQATYLSDWGTAEYFGNRNYLGGPTVIVNGAFDASI